MEGSIASVMDAATFWAVFPQVKDGMGLTTVEIKVNFLAPIQKGKLVAKGRCIKIGKTLALGDAMIHDAKGNLLAHGTATMMIVPDLKVEGQENLPPKNDMIFSSQSSIEGLPIFGCSSLLRYTYKCCSRWILEGEDYDLKARINLATKWMSCEIFVALLFPFFF